MRRLHGGQPRIITGAGPLLPQDAWALPMPGLDGAKAHTITTGTPGAMTCEGGELLVDDDSRSSMSLVKPLSSLESIRTEQPPSSAHAADEMALGGSLSPGSASAEESRLRRSSRNHGSPDPKPVSGSEALLSPSQPESLISPCLMCACCRKLSELQNERANGTPVLLCLQALSSALA